MKAKDFKRILIKFYYNLSYIIIIKWLSGGGHVVGKVEVTDLDDSLSSCGGYYVGDLHS